MLQLYQQIHQYNMKNDLYTLYAAENHIKEIVIPHKQEEKPKKKEKIIKEEIPSELVQDND